VHDAFLVGGGQSLGEPGGDLEDPLDRKPSLGDQPVERLALHQLHRQELNAVGLFDGEHGDDAGVVDGRQRLRLAAEALEAVEARGHLGRQHLERHR